MDFSAATQSIRDDSGFDLPSLAVAVAILLFVVVSAMGAFAAAADGTQSTSRREGALNLANERLEDARNLAYDDLGVVGGDPVGLILPAEQSGPFTVNTAVSWARDAATSRATYKKIVITVSWTEPRSQSLQVESAIYGKSNLINTGDVEVSVIDADTNQPIPGATVALTPTGKSAHTVYSGSDGKAFFGSLSAGTGAVTVSTAGYVFDLSQVKSISIAPALLTPLTVFGYRPCTANVHVKNQTGNPIPGAVVKLTQTGGTITTPGSGVASFTSLRTGTYNLTVTATGRANAAATFTIPTSGQTLDVDIVMPDPSELRVHVVNSIGSTPISGATVTLIAPGGGAAPGSPAATTASGQASFTLAVSGSYLVSVVANGFTSVSNQAVNVVVGTPLDFQVTMSATAVGSLQVTVKDKNGHLVTDRRIHVTCSNPVYSKFFSYTGTGIFLITNLTPGRYTVVPARNSSDQDASGQVSVAVDVTAGAQPVLIDVIYKS